MAWLRVDDGLGQHPKILGLSRADRWTWMEVLLYCARYRTDGKVPGAITEVVRGATPAFLKKACDLRLLDTTERADGWQVHDWNVYNPPRADDLDDQVTAILSTNPQASANQVCKAIGGSRNQVLAAIRRYRSGIGSVRGVVPSGTEVVPETGTENGTSTGIARAAPTPKDKTKGFTALDQPAHDHLPGEPTPDEQPQDFTSLETLIPDVWPEHIP